jgi:hypothetical protein
LPFETLWVIEGSERGLLKVSEDAPLNLDSWIDTPGRPLKILWIVSWRSEWKWNNTPVVARPVESPTSVAIRRRPLQTLGFVESLELWPDESSEPVWL